MKTSWGSSESLATLGCDPRCPVWLPTRRGASRASTLKLQSSQGPQQGSASPRAEFQPHILDLCGHRQLSTPEWSVLQAK